MIIFGIILVMLVLMVMEKELYQLLIMVQVVELVKTMLFLMQV